MEWRCRSLRYCGIYRPACRMNQTGVTSVRSRRHALRNRETLRLDVWGSDEDRVAVHFDLERRHGMDWGPAEDTAGLQREHSFVPGTGYRAVRCVDLALRQTGASVGAAVRDRVHRAVQIAERDRVVRRVTALR